MKSSSAAAAQELLSRAAALESKAESTLTESIQHTTCTPSMSKETAGSSKKKNKTRRGGGRKSGVWREKQVESSTSRGTVAEKGGPRRVMEDVPAAIPPPGGSPEFFTPGAEYRNIGFSQSAVEYPVGGNKNALPTSTSSSCGGDLIEVGKLNLGHLAKSLQLPPPGYNRATTEGARGTGGGPSSGSSTSRSGGRNKMHHPEQPFPKPKIRGEELQQQPLGSSFDAIMTNHPGGGFLYRRETPPGSALASPSLGTGGRDYRAGRAAGGGRTIDPVTGSSTGMPTWTPINSLATNMMQSNASSFHGRVCGNSSQSSSPKKSQSPVKTPSPGKKVSQVSATLSHEGVESSPEKTDPAALLLAAKNRTFFGADVEHHVIATPCGTNNNASLVEEQYSIDEGSSSTILEDAVSNVGDTIRLPPNLAARAYQQQISEPNTPLSSTLHLQQHHRGDHVDINPANINAANPNASASQLLYATPRCLPSPMTHNGMKIGGGPPAPHLQLPPAPGDHDFDPKAETRRLQLLTKLQLKEKENVDLKGELLTARSQLQDKELENRTLRHQAARTGTGTNGEEAAEQVKNAETSKSQGRSADDHSYAASPSEGSMLGELVAQEDEILSNPEVVAALIGALGGGDMISKMKPRGGSRACTSHTHTGSRSTGFLATSSSTTRRGGRSFDHSARYAKLRREDAYLKLILSKLADTIIDEGEMLLFGNRDQPGNSIGDLPSKNDSSVFVRQETPTDEDADHGAASHSNSSSSASSAHTTSTPTSPSGPPPAPGPPCSPSASRSLPLLKSLVDLNISTPRDSTFAAIEDGISSFLELDQKDSIKRNAVSLYLKVVLRSAGLLNHKLESKLVTPVVSTVTAYIRECPIWEAIDEQREFISKAIKESAAAAAAASRTTSSSSSASLGEGYPRSLSLFPQFQNISMPKLRLDWSGSKTSLLSTVASSQNVAAVDDGGHGGGNYKSEVVGARSGLGGGGLPTTMTESSSSSSSIVVMQQASSSAARPREGEHGAAVRTHEHIVGVDAGVTLILSGSESEAGTPNDVAVVIANNVADLGGTGDHVDHGHEGGRDNSSSLMVKQHYVSTPVLLAALGCKVTLKAVCAAPRLAFTVATFFPRLYVRWLVWGGKKVLGQCSLVFEQEG